MSESTPTIVNLLIYSISANDPALPELEEAVSLDLGVMADLGKLMMSAWNSHTDNWTVSMYLDMYPTHYIIKLSKTNGQVQIIRTEVLQQDKHIKAKDRIGSFISKNYLHTNGVNAFIIGGHGDIINGKPYYSPVSLLENTLLENNKIDNISIEELAKTIMETLKKPKPFAFVCLDACGLATLETVSQLKDTTDWLMAYPDYTPWNGFVNIDVIDICCQCLSKNVSVQECLSKVVMKYTLYSESQEDPSGVTVFHTQFVDQLSNIVTKLVSEDNNKQKEPVDLLTYIETKLNNLDFQEFKKIFDKVVVSYKIPWNNHLRENPLSETGIYL